MSRARHLWKFIKAHKLWLIFAGVIVVAGGAFMSLGGNGIVETVSPRTADLVRTVRISGKVTPREKVDLGFEISGTVTSVGKPVGARVTQGEVLARLDAGSIGADIQKAEAELASAQAEFNKLEGTQAYENDVTSAKRTVAQAIRDAYTAASDAVGNKADQLFIDPLTGFPQIKGTFGGHNDLRDSVNKGRVSIGYTLDAWQKLLNGLGTSTYSDAQLTLSKQYLNDVTTFISNVSQAANMFETTSYMPQSTIDGYKADMLSARQSLSTGSQGFITAENGLSTNLSDVPVQVARVEAAKATLLNLRFKLGKNTLTAPFSGIVSRQDAKVGQAMTAGTIAASVISPDYIIETFVPEVSIPGIQRGNIATVTFDAYGSSATFPATVEHIDPAETIRDGVSTYKVRLVFTTQDERIRSGLTSNVAIETLRKPDVVLIPERAVVRDGEEAFVYVLRGENEEKVTVTLGDRDSQGNVELLSNLSTTDQIIVNPEE